MGNNAYGRNDLLRNAPKEVARCHEHHQCDCIAYDRMYQRRRLAEIAKIADFYDRYDGPLDRLQRILEIAEGRDPEAFFKSVGVVTTDKVYCVTCGYDREYTGGLCDNCGNPDPERATFPMPGSKQYEREIVGRHDVG